MSGGMVRCVANSVTCSGGERGKRDGRGIGTKFLDDERFGFIGTDLHFEAVERRGALLGLQAVGEFPSLACGMLDDDVPLRGVAVMDNVVEGLVLFARDPEHALGNANAGGGFDAGVLARGDADRSIGRVREEAAFGGLDGLQ